MARIEDLNPSGGIGGPVDYAPSRPDQTFNRLGQEAEAANNFLEQMAERDAVLEGASALADFQVERSKRQTEMRTNAKSPDGFADAAEADFDEHAEKFVSAHENPRVQAFLEQRLVEARAGEIEESGRWQAAAMVARSEKLTADTINKYSNMVTSAPGRFDGAMKDVMAAIEASGMPAANADHFRTVAARSLSRSAVYGQIETNPYGVLKQLQSGAWDTHLDNDAKISAINAAQSEIKRRESEAKANASMARQEALFDIGQWAKDNAASLQATGKPVPSPYTDDQLKALLKPKQYESLKHTNDQAAALFSATGDMRTQTPAEMVATIEKLKPAGGAEGFADQQAVYAAAGRIMQSTLAARKADPAAAARASVPNVALAWQQVEANPSDTGTLRVALKRTMAAQAALGIPAQEQKLMPEQLANHFAGQVSGAAPEDAAKVLKSIEAQFGPSYWGAAMKQLAPKLDGHARIAPVIKDSVQAALLISGSRAVDPKAGGGGIDQMRKAAGVTGAGDNSITAVVASDQRVKNLVSSISQRNDRLNYAGQIPQSIEVLALQRMRVYGEDKDTATEGAIKHIVQENYDSGTAGSRPFRIPKGSGDVDHIERAARVWQNNLKPEVLDVPADNASTPKGATAQGYASAIARNGYWVTNDEETGVILYSERGVPVTVKGMPIERMWSDLTAAELPKALTDAHGNKLVR